MKKINVNLRERSYPIYIGNDLHKEIDHIPILENIGQKWVIISHEIIMEIIGKKITSVLRSSGFDCEHIIVPEGDSAKTIDEYSKIISQLVKFGCDRKSVILALGGGVIGDISGFVASSFMRGIKYYQIPTTLLSMVDSSIGGKTGLNLSEGKNLIGSFYQPAGVLIDPKALKSLPANEVHSGISEIIKYGAIQDDAFLNNIDDWLNDIDSFPFSEAILKSCKTKSEIISKDEHENHLRKILNFGHTIGHALEAYFGFGKILHGEAVAHGMICAGWVSKETGNLSDSEYRKLCKIIKKIPLPKIKEFDTDKLMGYIKSDKKNELGNFCFILLNKLGNAIIEQNISEKIIIKSFDQLK